MFATIGTQTIIILTLPHNNKPLSGLEEARDERTFLNLNKRNDNGIAHIVTISIIDNTRNAALVFPWQHPGSNVSVSNNTTIAKDNKMLKHISAIKILLVRSIIYYCNIHHTASGHCHFPSKGTRFTIERPRVTSSAYSSSPPTAIPRAITLSFTPYPANFLYM